MTTRLATFPTGTLRTSLPGAVGAGRDDQADPGEDCRAGFVESPWRRSRGSRGAITGVVLGAALWGGILIAAGVLRL